MLERCVRCYSRRVYPESYVFYRSCLVPTTGLTCHVCMANNLPRLARLTGPWRSNRSAFAARLLIPTTKPMQIICSRAIQMSHKIAVQLLGQLRKVTFLEIVLTILEPLFDTM